DVQVVAAVRQGDPNPHAGAGVGDPDDLAAQSVPPLRWYQVQPRVRRGSSIRGFRLPAGGHGVLPGGGVSSCWSVHAGGVSSSWSGSGRARRARPVLPTAGPAVNTSRLGVRRRAAAAGSPCAAGSAGSPARAATSVIEARVIRDGGTH